MLKFQNCIKETEIGKNRNLMDGLKRMERKEEKIVRVQTEQYKLLNMNNKSQQIKENKTLGTYETLIKGITFLSINFQ